MLGRYGPDGIRLSEARELLAEAKKTLAAGRSPARQKVTAAARSLTVHSCKGNRGMSHRLDDGSRMS